MPKKRRKHNAELKAKVALDAASGRKTTSEIATTYEVHPTQVSQWKKELLEKAASVFDGKRPGNDQAELEAMRQRHHAKIGQLSLEVDWLKKKCKELQIPLSDEL